MKTCGIITEYNPFHQGHIYHIKKTKELTQCDCLIAIVSNHFTQRGLPSGSLTLAHSRNSQMSFMYGFFFVKFLFFTVVCVVIVV